MGLILDYINGQTPLDEEERNGLKVLFITTRGELDEFEQQNIENAIQWALLGNFKSDDVLSESFIKNLHRRMFKDVWKWAGSFRKSNKNLGVEYWKISMALRDLLDDTKYWIANGTYEYDEIAIRFKHRIVSIHCFPNGNGRHSRLIADIIVEKILKQPAFTWGSSNLSDENDVRASYLKAIKAADKGDYSLLLVFARS